MPSKAQSSTWGSPFYHQARCFMRPFLKVLRSSNNTNFLNFFYNFVMAIAKTQPRICALIRNETSLNYSPLPKVLRPFSAYGWGAGGGGEGYTSHNTHVTRRGPTLSLSSYTLHSLLHPFFVVSSPQLHYSTLSLDSAHASSRIINSIFTVPCLSVLSPFLYTVSRSRAHPCTPQRQSSFYIVQCASVLTAFLNTTSSCRAHPCTPQRQSSFLYCPVRNRIRFGPQTDKHL